MLQFEVWFVFNLYFLVFQASLQLNDRAENDLVNDKTIMVMIFGQMIDHDITLTPLRKSGFKLFLTIIMLAPS